MHAHNSESTQPKRHKKKASVIIIALNYLLFCFCAFHCRGTESPAHAPGAGEQVTNASTIALAKGRIQLFNARQHDYISCELLCSVFVCPLAFRVSLAPRLRARAGSCVAALAQHTPCTKEATFHIHNIQCSIELTLFPHWLRYHTV